MDIAYPVVLRKNGYYTGLFGKFGVDFKDAESLFDKADIYDRNDKFKDRRGYFYKTIGKDTVHLTRFTGYEGQEFIRHAPKDKPFCLALYFSAPHAHDPAPEELYDLKNDPMEKINLAKDPEYRNVLDNLCNVCNARIQKYVAAKLCPDTVDPRDVKVNF